jgi:sec-independent protein translocase protein TatA
MGGMSWTEILFILVVALIIFGPRKLPELGKSLGGAISQFKKASEEFKRSWEDEVETEKEREKAKALTHEATEARTDSTTETAQTVAHTEPEQVEHWM